MKKRLFTFGCSFTNYRWPTWADIVSQDYDYYENWGKIGGGNKFIYFSLIECHQRNNITADDTVMIMWSSQAREDRYINEKWHTPGSVYNSDYDEDFINKFVDITGYLLETATYMQGSYNLLDTIGCKKHFLSMLPLNISTDTGIDDYPWVSRLIQKLNPDVSSKILKLYSASLKHIKPSIYETVFNNDWHSRDNKLVPIPAAELKGSADTLHENYESNAGIDWPTFDNFFNNKLDNIELQIIEEINKRFNFIAIRDEIKLLKRSDHHPTPIEHLEYLDCINFFVSKKARNFAKHWEDRVMSDANINWESKTLDRF